MNAHTHTRTHTHRLAHYSQGPEILQCIVSLQGLAYTRNYVGPWLQLCASGGTLRLPRELHVHMYIYIGPWFARQACTIHMYQTL